MSGGKQLADELSRLVEQARARYDALSPEEKRAHDKAQARSFVKGQLECDGKTFDEEAFERAWERR